MSFTYFGVSKGTVETEKVYSVFPLYEEGVCEEIPAGKREDMSTQ